MCPQGQSERLVLHKQARPIRAAGELQPGGRLLQPVGGGGERHLAAAAAGRLGQHAGGNGAPLSRSVRLSWMLFKN